MKTIRHKLFTAFIIVSVSMNLTGHLHAEETRPNGADGTQSGAFGICNSAEGGGDYPRYFPEMRKAGVTIVRGFPEWQSLQPKKGEWKFEHADNLLKCAAENNLEILGTFGYLTEWSSSGGTRTFPVKDMQYWRDYVRGCVSRYHDRIKYWGVYNEFQGFSKNGTPKDYVKLLRDAYTEAKKIDPTVRIGLATSSVDISFMEQVIKLGGADHFDWIDIHPYELQGAIAGGRESIFLQIMSNFRKMLKRHNQREDIEVLVGEVGAHVVTPEDEARQADMLVKTYVLCLAQGIKKAFWFEARGPYNMGLIRSDKEWTKRPAYFALKNMTDKLSKAPKSLGWLDLTGKSYGFVFDGRSGPVLVTWAMTDEGDTVQLDTGVTVTDILGESKLVKAGENIALSRAPVFVTGLSEKLSSLSKANSSKAFPWISDYSKAKTVSCRMGAANAEMGLMLNDGWDGLTVLEILKDGSYARRTNKKDRIEYMYFDVDDSYVAAGDHELKITFTARAFDLKRGASCNITYESTNKYRDTAEYWKLPQKPGWHTFTFKLSDANFGNNWGWNFRLRICGSPGDVLVQKVSVKRIGKKN
jgi:hypothetical protein